MPKRLEESVDWVGIGHRIKAVREGLHLKQGPFGGSLGVKQGVISRYEGASLHPPLDMLTKIARLGRVSLDWLVNGSDALTGPESSFPYGISSEEYKFLALYRGSDEVGREDARCLLERHQERAKKKAGH